MGNGAILLVFVAAFTIYSATSSRHESEIYRALVDADYQDEVITREMAQSAFNIVVSQVKRDFENYRGSVSDKTYAATRYEYSAVDGTLANEVVVTAKGMLNNHEFEIIGTITLAETHILDAITVDGPVKSGKTQISNDVIISGHDTNPDGTTGPSSSVYAILATTDKTLQDIKSGNDSSNILGKAVEESSDNLSMFSEPPVMDLDELAEAIEAYSGPNLIEYSGDVKWKDTTIGSEAQPQVIRVDGDVEISGNSSGYGVLYVYGDMKIKDNSKWHGVIFQSYDGGKFETDGNAVVYGAIVARSIKGAGSGGGDIPDRGLPGGHFDVDVFDSPNSTQELYHEHQYDDKFDVTGTNLLQAGCKSGGGLCWNNIVGAYAGNEVEIGFKNTNNASGTYQITADGVHYAGSSTTGFDRLRVDPTKITTFATNFADLCDLKPTEPGIVQRDPATRNGAFTIQIFGIDEGGNTGDLIHELSVYHHWKPEDGECIPGGGDGETATAGSEPGKAMEFKIKGNSKLFYSSVMLRQMNSLINEFEFDESGFIVKRNTETPLRVGRILSLLDRPKMSEAEYLQRESPYLNMLKKTTVDLRNITSK